MSLVDDLVAPHAIHRLAGFDGELTDSLTREPCSVGTRYITLKHLEVFAWVYFTVVVIPDKAGGVDLMDTSVILSKFHWKPGLISWSHSPSNQIASAL